VNRAAVIFRRVTRANIDGFVVARIWSGHAVRANIKIIELNGEKFVLKDFAGKGMLARCGLGRLLVGHEFRIYQRLEGIPGIPRVYHRVDPDAFIMEYVHGRPLKDLYHNPVSDAFVHRLEKLVAAMHARGVVHLDLHQRRNIIITPDDRPCLIDFATALYLGRSAFAQERLFPMLGAADVSGILKIKKWHAPHLLDPGERKRLRRMEKYRKLWIFTPVHVSTRKPPCPQAKN
jgi:serine/threonine protein kinase